MRCSRMRLIALVPALVMAQAAAQERAQFGSVQMHQITPVQQVKPLVVDGQPAPLQIRLIEGVIAGHIRVEVDLAAAGSQMALLISDQELLQASMGTPPALLKAQLVVGMSRINPQTFAIDLPTNGLKPGVVAYLQAVGLEAGGGIRSSAVVPLEICQSGQPCGAIILGFYGGSAQFAVSPMISIDRLPPNVSSWAVDIDVTVRSNDWDLSHQVTRQGPSGTDIFMILKKPGPGEGLLDVVETHSVQVDLGAGNPGRLTIYVGVTEIYQPPPSTLQFQQLQR